MIDGLATDTIVASTRIMKKPTIMAHRACHGSATGAAPAAGRPPSAVVISLLPSQAGGPRPSFSRWCRLTPPVATAFGLFSGTAQPPGPRSPAGRRRKTGPTVDYPDREVSAGDGTDRWRPRQLRRLGQCFVGNRHQGVVAGRDAD